MRSAKSPVLYNNNRQLRLNYFSWCESFAFRVCFGAKRRRLKEKKFTSIFVIFKEYLAALKVLREICFLSICLNAFLHFQNECFDSFREKKTNGKRFF